MGKRWAVLIATGGLLALCAEVGASTVPQAMHLAAIPLALVVDANGGAALATPAGLSITAGKGSDLFVNPDGTEVADKTPRVMFRPVGDFIFSARVDAGFHHEFDGGGLIVYIDKVNWAKLLFEYSKFGKPALSSTVAKGTGDDAHHGAVEGHALYLKIARRKDMFVFYTSRDGADWRMVRTFGVPPGASVSVGFSAQSPVGPSFSATYSDIRFRALAFKDYWQGE